MGFERFYDHLILSKEVVLLTLLLRRGINSRMEGLTAACFLVLEKLCVVKFRRTKRFRRSRRVTAEDESETVKDQGKRQTR